MRTNVEIDPKLERALGTLRDLPERDPEKAALGKTVFLAQAQQMAELLPAGLPTREKRRQGSMLAAIPAFLFLNKRERVPGFNVFSVALLVVFLFLAGGGITLAAAQRSMPEDGLYPVKTWSEQIRFAWTKNSGARLQLTLAFVNRRAEELHMMLRAGQVPPEGVQAGLRDEIDQALQLVTEQPESEKIPSLLQIQTQLQAQEQAFIKLDKPSDPRVNAVLVQVQGLLQARIRICKEAVKDSAALREMLRNPDRLQAETPAGKSADQQPSNTLTGETPVPGAGFGPGPGSTQAVDAKNPLTGDATPGPESGEGPGPVEKDGCEGCGEEGQGPQVTEPPQPGGGGQGQQPAEPPHTGGDTDAPGSQPTTAPEPGDGGETGPGAQPSEPPSTGSDGGNPGGGTGTGK